MRKMKTKTECLLYALLDEPLNNCRYRWLPTIHNRLILALTCFQNSTIHNIWLNKWNNKRWTCNELDVVLFCFVLVRKAQIDIFVWHAGIPTQQFCTMNVFVCLNAYRSLDGVGQKKTRFNRNFNAHFEFQMVFWATNIFSKYYDFNLFLIRFNASCFFCLLPSTSRVFSHPFLFILNSMNINFK